MNIFVVVILVVGVGVANYILANNANQETAARVATLTQKTGCKAVFTDEFTTVLDPSWTVHSPERVSPLATGAVVNGELVFSITGNDKTVGFNHAMSGINNFEAEATVTNFDSVLGNQDMWADGGMYYGNGKYVALTLRRDYFSGYVASLTVNPNTPAGDSILSPLTKVYPDTTKGGPITLKMKRQDGVLAVYINSGDGYVKVGEVSDFTVNAPQLTLGAYEGGTKSQNVTMAFDNFIVRSCD